MQKDIVDEEVTFAPEATSAFEKPPRPSELLEAPSSSEIVGPSGNREAVADSRAAVAGSSPGAGHRGR